MSLLQKKKWFKPMCDFDEVDSSKTSNSIKLNQEKDDHIIYAETLPPSNNNKKLNMLSNLNNKDWMKNFDPVTVEDLAMHNKKIQEVETWMKNVCNSSNNDMLLITGPVGCGKTVTLLTLAAKYNIKVSEWVTPLDIDIPSEYGEFEYKEKQTKKFLDFILNAANYTSLLDNNSSKLVLVEDFPNIFTRTPMEFTDVLQLYKQRAKSPIVFICSESYTDNKNSSLNLFTSKLKEQFNIYQIAFNSVSTTGLRSALKRVSDIISKKYVNLYNIPSTDVIECVVNSSAGDVRSAVLNLHFACLKGSTQNLETSLIAEKENKNKQKRRKKASSKFLSLGKDQTVSILHGVGRVLNPKVAEDGGNKFSHAPKDLIEQFLSQPSSFINFLGENYLSHFSCINHVERAASTLSDADCMLAEWKDKNCIECGLYTAVAGLMVANKAPESAWNPVRGPKNIIIRHILPEEIPQLQQDYLYQRKVLVADFQTYCKIIGNNKI